MAQILIGEAFRLSRLSGCQIQYYGTGQSNPTPFATSHYMNKFLDAKKLVDVHYCLKPGNMTMDQFVKANRLPKKDMINIEGSIRRMQKKDVTQVLKLLQNQQKKYKFRYKYSQEDIIHYLIPKEEDNLTWTYVIENEDENGKVIITDFFSMNRLTNTCTDKNRSEYGHNHKEMNIALAYLYALSKNTL